MTVDMATLTGAYAVDALDGQERIAFERHLMSCSDCAHEVAELQEAAAVLGADTTVAPPKELKQRVLTEIARTRQDPPQIAKARSRGAARARARSWGVRLAAAAAAVGVALAAVFGVLAWHTSNELSDARQLAEQAGGHGAQMAHLLQQPDVHLVHGSSGPARVTTVMSRGMGKAMVLGRGMPEPPPDRAYQLWTMGPGGASPAGMLPSVTGTPTTSVTASLPADAGKMAITVEPTGGSPQPTTKPVLVMSLPT